MKTRTSIHASLIMEERNLPMSTGQLPKPDRKMKKSSHWHHNLLHALGTASPPGDRGSCPPTSIVVVQDVVVCGESMAGVSYVTCGEKAHASPLACRLADCREWPLYKAGTSVSPGRGLGN